MRVTFLFFFLLGIGSHFVLQAQENEKIRVKGIVLNQDTREPVVFANIGLVGTSVGTAADMKGYFELTVLTKYASHVVRFSAIGYASHEVNFSELRGRGEVEILLKPVAYSIQNVSVTGQGMQFRSLFDRVIERMGKNYISRPYNYEGYFEYGVSVNGGEKKTKEAIVTIYDSRGYQREDIERNFTALNYTFNHIRRSHEATTALDGMVYFDDILTSDIVRHTRNVLDTRNYRRYTFRNKGVFKQEGDSIQIIGYEAINPSISITGDASVLKYSGEIYVQLKDAVVIKNVMTIVSSHFVPMGRNLKAIDAPAQREVTTTIITNYEKRNSYHFLSGVSMLYSYHEGANRIQGEVQYQTTRVNTNEVVPVAGRIYLESMDPDYSFWDRYTINQASEE